MASTAQYAALITSEHADKPKFVATVSAVATCFAGATNAADALPTSFDLDTAIGAQLDAIGLWVGLSRQVAVTLAVYFSFDVPGLGWDQGSIYSPGNQSTGLTALDDETYRTLLRAKIGANNWDGTLASFNAILGAVFAPLGIIAVATDNQDMTMTVYLVGNAPSAILAAVLADGYLALKPEGVLITGFLSITNPLFGFDIENQIVSGFDVGHLSANS